MTDSPHFQWRDLEELHDPTPRERLNAWLDQSGELLDEEAKWLNDLTETVSQERPRSCQAHPAGRRGSSLMFEHTQDVATNRVAAENQATDMVEMVLAAVTDQELREQSWRLTIYLRPQGWEQEIEPGGVTPY